jgi:type VI secretion system protein ImpM
MQADTLPAACLGKLPTAGDFVRHRASTPTMRAFDEWVQHGLYQARQRQNGWEAAYDTAPTTRFVFQGRRAPNALLGVLRPSRDRTGRAYPFMVAAEVPTRRLSIRHLAYLPLQAGRFFDAADRVVREATEGDIPYREVPDHVQQIDTAFGVRPTAPRTYKRYLQQHTMGPFLEELFGHFGDSGKYRLFDNLLDVLLPLRGRSAPRLNYGLQFPLGGDDEALTAISCFWLEACLRLLDYPSDAEPTFFWTDRPPPDAAPFLLLFFGAPRPHAFFHLMASDDPHELVYPLAHAGDDGAEAALSIPEEYGRLLETEQITLWNFLREL